MSTLFANNKEGLAPMALQDLPSGRKTYPCEHSHTKEPLVFVHF